MGIWESLGERGREVQFSPDEVLLRHGEATRHCYAIRSGEVLVTATSSTGSNVVLARRGPGTVIGELGALDGQPRSATVTAISDVNAVVLSADDLAALLSQNPELALAEIRRLSGQLREITERYAVRGKEVKSRLSQLLSTHAAESGSNVFRSTREELAGWVGATREAVIRTLHIMESAGMVKLRRGAVEWIDGP